MTLHGVHSAEFDAIAEIAAEYGVGPIRSAARSPSGSMNEVFLLGTDDRSVVLRRHRRTDRSLVELEHRVMDHARRHGIPVPAALVTRDGDRIVEWGGQWHSMFAFAAGRQLEVAELDAARVSAMGAMLAQIHLVLADFPAPDGGPARPRPTVAQTLEQLQRIKAAISASAELIQQDGEALEHLDSKARALRAGTPPLEPANIDSAQQIHGDYVHVNLFFDDDTVSGVIDWDKTEVLPPSQEIIRAMDLSLELQPALCRAFIDGYRDIRPLPSAALDAGAAEYGFGHLHGLWVHESVYLRSDDRIRKFLTPAPFVPFSDRWADLRPALA